MIKVSLILTTEFPNLIPFTCSTNVLPAQIFKFKKQKNKKQNNSSRKNKNKRPTCLYDLLDLLSEYSKLDLWLIAMCCELSVYEIKDAQLSAWWVKQSALCKKIPAQILAVLH